MQNTLKYYLFCLHHDRYSVGGRPLLGDGMIGGGGGGSRGGGYGASHGPDVYGSVAGDEHYYSSFADSCE